MQFFSQQEIRDGVRIDDGVNGTEKYLCENQHGIYSIGNKGMDHPFYLCILFYGHRDVQTNEHIIA
jgi:hypothetical protein